MQTNRSVVLVSLVLAAVGSALLGGCSSEKAKVAPVANASAQGGPAAIPTEVANDVKTRRQASVTTCGKGSPDGWTAEGTLHNPGTEEKEYKVTVFFTTTKATVLDYATTAVTVPAGASSEWKAHKSFKAPAKVLCVLRGVA